MPTITQSSGPFTGVRSTNDPLDDKPNLFKDRRIYSIQEIAIEAKPDGENAELDVRLETHRRLLDARLRYHQAEVEYVLALRNVHFEKGSLLKYCNVNITEACSPAKAQNDAVERIENQDSHAVPATRDTIIGKNG